MEPLLSGDPTLLGPFRLLGRLGAGGMGQVFLGRDSAGNLAAVKVIHPGLTGDRQFRQRFAREIATARAVRAPWTAVVLDADPDGPRPWLATEYVSGPSLDAAVAQHGPLPGAAVDVLAARLAESIAALHATGIVHRDRKPSNVLLAADGPRVIDFGIARAADSTRITHTGLVVGTPAFMSPEQAMGEPTGEPSDVFSLASVVVFAATGSGPFGRTGHPVAMLRKVAVAEPELAAVPDALRADLVPCLAKDPGQRPSAAQLAHRLARRAPADSAWPAWQPPAVAAPPSRRTKLIVAAALAAVAVVGAALLVSAPRGADPVTAAPQPAAGTSAVPTITPAAPPSAIVVGAVPSRIEGWLAAVTTTRNAAYDVPPTWTPGSPDLVKGFEQGAQTAVLSGIAEIQNEPCAGADLPHVPVWAGITGADPADSAEAADLLAQIWVLYFQADGGPVPGSTIGAPTPVTIADGVAASHVVTVVDVPTPGPCGTPRAVIHTVAAPSTDGKSVVWVLLADRDVPDTPPDAEIGQIISTLRPAGLPCDPERNAQGSWC
jgi:hypothetical protein